MFFDNLPLEMTCSKCGKQINETVNWLKADSRKCRYWEIIADKLSKAGWRLGWVSAVDSEGRTIFIADAHGGDGKP